MSKLSELVKNEFDVIDGKKSFTEKINYFINRNLLVFNGVKSLLCFFSIIAIILFLSAIVWHLLLYPILDSIFGAVFLLSDNALREIFITLLEVQSGITAISIPLLFYLIDKSGDVESSPTNAVKVLIRETAILPILVLSFIITLVMLLYLVNVELIATHSFSIIILFVVTVVMTLYAYIKTISMLSSRSTIAKKGEEFFLKEVIKERVNDLIKTRIGINILIGILKDNNVEYKEYNNRDSILLKTKKPLIGKVVDIEISLLELFIKNIRFKFLQPSHINEATQAKDEPVIFFRILYQEELIHQDEGVVFEIITNEKVPEIEAVWDGIVKVGSKDEQSVRLDYIREELNELHKRFIKSIHNKDTVNVAQHSDFLIKIIKKYLKSMKSAGITHSLETAKLRQKDIFNIDGWSELRWLQDILINSIDQSVKEGDRLILFEIQYLPFRFISLSLEYEDHYFYNEFKNIMPYIYSSCLKIENNELRQIVIERMDRNLCEFLEYYVYFDVDEHGSENISYRHKFGRGFISTINSILKNLYDKKEIEIFISIKTNLSRVLSNLMEHRFNVGLIEGDISDVKWRISSLSEDDPQLVELKSRLEYLEEFKFVANDLQLLFNVMYLGLSAFHLSKTELNADKWIEIFKFTKDFKILWSALNSSMEGKYEHIFKWSWWELEGHPQGEVITYSSSDKLMLSFCTYALMLDKTELEKVSNEIDFSISCKSYLGERLLKTLQSIEGSNVEALLEDYEEKVDIIGTILHKAIDKYNTDITDRIISSAIDLEKIKTLKKCFYDKWEKISVFNSGIGELLENLVGEVVDKKGLIGFNKIEKKEYFLSEAIEQGSLHDSFSQVFGENLAENLVNYEKAQIVKIAIESISEEQINIIESNETLVSSIDNAIEELLSQNCQPVIIFNSWIVKDILVSQDSKFKGNSENIGFIGTYSGIDAYSLFQCPRDKIIIADLKQLIVVNRFSPIKEEDEDEIVGGKFLFHFSEITDDRAKELISKNEELTLEINGEKLTYADDASRFMKQLKVHVHIKVFEYLEFTSGNSSAGYILDVKNVDFKN